MYQIGSRLKEILTRKKLGLIMEVHNGLSAKIVEKCGFEAGWASGFTISSSYGLRDCNELSISQLLDTVNYIIDSVQIPILVDGDSGFGDFNNVRILIKKLEKAGAGGVVIEDKTFPKINSFINLTQSLCGAEEFVGKIKSAVDHRRSNEFVVIARIESFIAGYDINHALERALKYKEAGCDAIFIHSKLKQPTEILDFMKLWDNDTPIIIAPTTYYKTLFMEFEKNGISACICANQNLRAAAKAMLDISSQIIREYSLIDAENNISSIDSIFELLNYKEFEDAKLKY